MEKKVYHASKNAILRIPLLSINSYDKFIGIEEENNYEDMLAMFPEFLEAIHVASPTLYDAIVDRKVGEKQKKAIFKYFVRAITRPTPYGLFAGIGNVIFGQETNICVNMNENKKHCEADWKWVYAVVKILESDSNIVNNASVVFNECVYVNGDRIINPYISDYGQGQWKNNKTSIRYTSVVQYIRRYARNWIPYNKLRIKLEAEFGNPEKVERVLLQLIKNDYMYSDFRIPIGDGDAINLLIKRLEDCKLDSNGIILKKKLCQISKIKEDYEKTRNGRGNEYLTLLYEMMQDLIDSSHYINVVSKIKMESQEISCNIKKEVEEVVDFLLVLSEKVAGSSHIVEYKKNFINRFGVDTEVSMLELFDENVGLGNPYVKKYFQTNEKYRNNQEIITEYMLEKITYAIQERSPVILDESDKEFFESIEVKKDNNFVAKTCEINVRISAQNKEDISNGNFMLEFAPCMGSMKVGSLLNRFHSAISEPMLHELKEIYSKEMDEATYIICDTSYMPHDGRTNNVCGGYKNYKYSLDLLTASSEKITKVNIEDLYIGYEMEEDRFYIRSKILGKRVQVISDSMLTDKIDNQYIRFLREISSTQQINPLNGIEKIRNYNLVYTPAIIYKKVIMQNERWCLDNLRKHNDKREFEIIFNEYCNKWNVPRYIYYIDYDKYLLLDRESQNNLELLNKEVERKLKKEERIFIEAPAWNTNKWLEDKEKNYYLAELIIELWREKYNFKQKHENNNTLLITKSDIYDNKSSISILDSDRILFWTDKGWIYYKIYISSNKADEFLVKLQSIVTFLVEKEVIDKFFFIRYTDPEFHIRVRVRVLNDNSKIYVMEYLGKWISDLRREQLVRTYKIDTYEREIERYGGRALIENAEKVFFWDSLLVIKLVESRIKNVFDYSDKIIGVYCVYHLIINYIQDTIDAEKLLNKFVDYKKYMNEFRSDKEQYMNFVSRDVEKLLPKEITSINEKRAAEIRNYRLEIDKIDNAGKLSNTKINILRVLIHMFCNRYKGESEWEDMVLHIVRHTIRTLNQREEHYKKV